VSEPEKRDSYATRVRRAKAILGSKYDKREIEGSVAKIVLAQARAEEPNFQFYAVSRRVANKKQKMAVDRVARSARRLIAALTSRDLPLPSFIRRKAPPLDSLRQLVDDCERLTGPLPKPRRPYPFAKISAAEEAALLLEERSIKLAATRNGMLCRLAAALHGTTDASLYHQCCAVVKRGRSRPRETTGAGLKPDIS
jgi:hypothetical protein